MGGNPFLYFSSNFKFQSFILYSHSFSRFHSFIVANSRLGSLFLHELHNFPFQKKNSSWRIVPSIVSRGLPYFQSSRESTITIGAYNGRYSEKVITTILYSITGEILSHVSIYIYIYIYIYICV